MDFSLVGGSIDPFILAKDFETLLTLYTVNKDANSYLSSYVCTIAKGSDEKESLGNCKFEYSGDMTFPKYACSYIQYVQDIKRKELTTKFDPLFKQNHRCLLKWALDNSDTFLVQQVLKCYTPSKRYKELVNAISRVTKTEYNKWRNREMRYLMNIMTPCLFNKLLKLKALPCEWSVLTQVINSDRIKYLQKFLEKHDDNLTVELLIKMFFKITCESNLTIFSYVVERYFTQLSLLNIQKEFFSTALKFQNILYLNDKILLIIEKFSPLKLDHRLLSDNSKCKNKELTTLVLYFTNKMKAEALFNTGIKLSSPLLITIAIKDYNPTQEQIESLLQILGSTNLLNFLGTL
jgi:hypothetical protein